MFNTNLCKEKDVKFVVFSAKLINLPISYVNPCFPPPSGDRASGRDTFLIAERINGGQTHPKTVANAPNDVFFFMRASKPPGSFQFDGGYF